MANRICHDSLFYERANRRIFRKYLCFRKHPANTRETEVEKTYPENTGDAAIADRKVGFGFQGTQPSAGQGGFTDTVFRCSSA
jgi:hypothetical protein